MKTNLKTVSVDQDDLNHHDLLETQASIDTPVVHERKEFEMAFKSGFIAATKYYGAFLRGEQNYDGVIRELLDKNVIDKKTGACQKPR